MELKSGIFFPAKKIGRKLAAHGIDQLLIFNNIYDNRLALCFAREIQCFVIVVVKEQKPAGKPFQQTGQMFRIVKILRLMGNDPAKDGDAGFQML